MSNSKHYYIPHSPKLPLSIPLKTQSTAHGEQSFYYGPVSTQQKRQYSFDHKEFLQNASSLTLGEQKIPEDDINQFFNQIRLLRFFCKEIKYNAQVIKFKNDANMTMQIQIEERKQKIKSAKQMYLNTKSAIQRKKLKILNFRRKQDSIIRRQTKKYQQKIIRMKSLCSERQQSPNISMSGQQNLNHCLRYKNRKHRRNNTQFNPSRDRRGKSQHKIFIPIYVPYPVMYPPASNYHHPLHQPQVINNFTANQNYQPSPSYPSPNPQNSKSVSNDQKLFTSRLRQFNSNLEVSLSNRQSRKSAVNNIVYSQDNKQPSSIRNSCQSATSKIHLSKKRSTKMPFITDDEMVEQPNSILQVQNNYSKMGFKITTSNPYQQTENKHSSLIKRKSKKQQLFQRFQTIEQINNSGLNISDKRDTSSWQKDTIKQPKQNLKNHQLIETIRLVKHEQSIVHIDPRDSDTNLHSETISDKVQIMVIPPITPKQIEQHNIIVGYSSFAEFQQKNNNLKPQQPSNTKQQYKSAIVDLEHSIQSKSQKNGRRIDSDNQSQIKKSSIILNKENDDDDMIFSINLMAESKISRNSIKDTFKDAIKDTIKDNTLLKPNIDQDEDILGSIRLSTLSRISRQKGALKTSQSEIKAPSVASPTEGRTSISDIRDTEHNNFRNTALTSIQEQQALDQLMELNISAPSRILKKSAVGKQKFKPNLDMANASIQQASEEEQSNSMSYIHKASKKKQKAG